MIERFNRSLKERIARYMTQNKTFIWVDVLDDLTNLYNNTKHSRTGFAPNDVGFHNADQIRKKLYGNKGSAECTLKINDVVRIPTNKTIFTKVCLFYYFKVKLRSRGMLLIGQKNCIQLV